MSLLMGPRLRRELGVISNSGFAREARRFLESLVRLLDLAPEQHRIETAAAATQLVIADRKITVVLAPGLLEVRRMGAGADRNRSLLRLETAALATPGEQLVLVNRLRRLLGLEPLCEWIFLARTPRALD